MISVRLDEKFIILLFIIIHFFKYIFHKRVSLYFRPFHLFYLGEVNEAQGGGTL